MLTIITKRITDHGEPIVVELICIEENNEVGKLRFDEPCSFCDEINLQELSVDPARRRTGIGTFLIKNLKELCINNYNSCCINAFIAPIDDTEIDELIRFYQANGFSVRKLKDAIDEAWGEFIP